MSHLGDFLNQEANDLDVYVANDKQINGMLGDLAGLGETNPDRQKAVKVISRALRARPMSPQASTSLSAKAEFEKRIGQLPAPIRAALASGDLQIVDEVLFVTRSISGVSSQQLFETSVSKTKGICNVDDGKLSADHWFLLIGMQLLYVVASGTANANLYVESFVTTLPANIKNGTFEFKQEQTTIVPESSCEMFYEAGNTSQRQGYFKLDNPKFLTPQKELKPKIEMPANSATNAAVKFVMYGAACIKR